MDLWAAVDRIVDRATNPAALRWHGLHLLAARRWRSTGRPVPTDFADAEREAVVVYLAGLALLRQIRDLVDGPIVVLKGIAVAQRYPDPALRPFADLDLLVPDPERVHRTLLAAGFAQTDDLEYPHHLPALGTPGSPLGVEVHASPGWLSWMTSPPVERLFERAVPADLGIDGILALPPALDAMQLVAHSWRHQPLRRLLDLVDVAATTDGLEPAELDALADDLGMGRVWRTTAGASQAAFSGAPHRSLATQTWARHLVTGRERTVLEKHLTNWLRACWATSVAGGAGDLRMTLRDQALPRGGEGWSGRVAWAGRAARDAFVPISRHDRRE